MCIEFSPFFPQEEAHRFVCTRLDYQLSLSSMHMTTHTFPRNRLCYGTGVFSSTTKPTAALWENVSAATPEIEFFLVGG